MISLYLKCFLSLITAGLLSTGCQSPDSKPAGTMEEIEISGQLPLHKIKLPPGFSISLYAEDVDNARSLARGRKGTIFVGTRREGSVYALKDTDGDQKADKKYILASGLKMPNGVAIRDGDLYVAEVNRILKFADIENHLSDPPEPEVIYDRFPTETHHGWKFIAFGPDGWLYVPVGAPCNICESEEEIYASISRIQPNGTGLEVYASGVRNTVGFAWHPDTKELWFTDNGRDMMGDDIPPCELNHAPEKGLHFGYPYCHAGDIADDEFGDKRSCDEFRGPAQKLGAHVAPLGMRFYTGRMFPEAYQGHIFFAEHGSWNRSKKSGYQLSLAKLEGDKIISYEAFASGWLDPATQEIWGRPVDVLQMPDGAMLVSDDHANAVYRITYTP